MGEGSVMGEISPGMRVVAKADKYDPPVRIGVVLKIFRGQYHARDKTFARVEWTYQRRYLTFCTGDTRRATLQTKALRPYEAA
jgi:hypothetical protein